MKIGDNNVIESKGVYFSLYHGREKYNTYFGVVFWFEVFFSAPVSSGRG